jgi:hypothetical protein
LSVFGFSPKSVSLGSSVNICTKKLSRKLLEKLHQPVEVCIDDWIQGAVEVADPKENRHQDVGTRTQFRPAKRRNHIPEEERKPAQKKYS